ncbi:MAG: hypothetical protein M3P96_09495 [Actinomycetota bacterium]|nr:hypothetical protein [Actinomycetota bacterium]
MEPAPDAHAALVEEATKRSALIWLDLPGAPQPRPAWHSWLDGRAYVVTGGDEQPLPGLEAADLLAVTVPSKDKGGRLVTWLARCQVVEPGTEEWTAATADLAAKRLNAADGERQPERWARESQVVRLEPTGQVPEHPGRMPDDARLAPPPPTPATTLGALPWVLGRRRGRRR